MRLFQQVFNRVILHSEYLTTQEYKHIVRILGNDIKGEKKLLIGLTQIRGVGYNFATAILDLLKINSNSNIGYLSDSQVQSIEKILQDTKSVNIPSWFLNRQKDAETGEDKHLLTSDIEFTIRNDIERERNTSSWRGYRHMYGLKVRGQRTRTTGRKGGAVGVAKGGKVQPTASATATPSADTATAGADATATKDASAPATAPAAAPADKGAEKKKE
jgi:small subunit ribosomal protein S13